ncbi:MAG: sigma-54-dependent Fis family transcriptional regulator [Candidatus Delongbacteria bacterium]|nr:sigma-54-dependent Fis family transcriptional regulator [Candidatus Delongbacteria bacterium]
MNDFRILVVDDEELMRDYVSETLIRKNYQVDIARNGKEALARTDDNQYHLIITDMKMPEVTGMDLLKSVKSKCPETFVVVLTAYGTVENAVEAMKLGAYDYLMKPCTADEIEMLVERVIQFQNLLVENKILKSQLHEKYDMQAIIGRSSVMDRVFELIHTVSNTRATVLIQGESGTGKELVARAIHYNSSRKNNNFIKMNCAALPEGLIESELFGHEKGSFTGAIRRTTGKFGLADGGTILLDEISEISPSLQAKLLRVLQEREFERIGGNQTIKIDVRIVATTNRDLKIEIEKGNFREDLYYRLNVFPLVLPPLRDRKEDIPLLVQHFIERFSLENGLPIRSVEPESMEKLLRHDWHGNVRELENIIERAVIISKTPSITPQDICLDDAPAGTPRSSAGDGLSIPFGQSGSTPPSGESKPFHPRTLAEMERNAILSALKQYNNNRTKAAEVLDISIRTLRNKLHEYRDTGVLPPEFELKQD